MSGRKNFFKRKMETAISLASSFETDPIELETISLVGFNIASSDISTNTGEFSVQHRINANSNQISEWCTLTLDSTPRWADEDDVLEAIAGSLPPGQVRLAFSAIDAQVQLLTFPTKAGSTDGDYVVITDKNGLEWAIALDKTGAAAAEPTGAAWADIPAGRKDYVDISAATTAASVAALIETALNALTGFSSVFTTDDTAANGTMELQSTAAGYGVAPVPHNADDSGAGSILGEIDSGPDGTADIYVSGAQE